MLSSVSRFALGLVAVSSALGAPCVRAFEGDGSRRVPVREDRVEMALENVFAPVEGYDDNDPVEVVFHGVLPNACYTLGDTFFEHDQDGRTIHLRQYVLRKKDKVCAEGSALPPHLAAAVPFTNSVALGTLPASDYALSFRALAGGVRRRTLSVAESRSSLVDSMPYAVVNTVMVPSIVSAQQNVEVTVSGVLNSTCVELSDQWQVLHQKDVVVVLPTVIVKENQTYCAQMLRPFTRTIQLGALPAGESLVHVRSMNGKSLNALVDVQAR